MCTRRGTCGRRVHGVRRQPAVSPPRLRKGHARRTHRGPPPRRHRPHRRDQTVGAAVHCSERGKPKLGGPSSERERDRAIRAAQHKVRASDASPHAQRTSRSSPTCRRREARGGRRAGATWCARPRLPRGAAAAPPPQCVAAAGPCCRVHARTETPDIVSRTEALHRLWPCKSAADAFRACKQQRGATAQLPCCHCSAEWQA